MLGFPTVLDTTLISENVVSTTVSAVSTDVVVGVDNSFWSQLFVNPSVTLTLILLGLNLVCHGRLKETLKKNVFEISLTTFYLFSFEFML